ncbi:MULTISPECIES: HpsJ family protein [unclassified Leptolyngbya]|uniref:HpsJ-like protein, cyanoexosortase A-associated n=1 Tax=unclassified Leptolyngbya TaxID=2650499 RepID=UPI001684EF8F|nr:MULTISPECIES: HpsJ family protein [unclassified Leptolyngbya]MBD1911489.1 hypothetical protein [Leptolyngbya sp. FACHB-8]MBD2155272.1 hypothetical protein [Leptolyngbya sp. FACHB-16]
MSQVSHDAPSKAFSFSIIRMVGYGLLLLSLLEYLTILIPPQLMNPEWEFSAMGQMVERVPVPLLALALVFLGDTQTRQAWERPCLKVLSWLALGFSLFLFLMIPLWGVMDTMRLNTMNEATINQQFQAQTERFTQFEQQLNQATPEDIANFLSSQGIKLEESTQPPKEQIMGQLQTLRQQMQTQADAEKAARRNTLLQSSIKWNLSALISSVLFAYVWYLTPWARIGNKKRSKGAKKPIPNPESL